MSSLVETIQQAVSPWEGVSVKPHRFGGVEFNFGTAEIGHIHLHGLLDIPFPVKIRNQLLAEGLVSKHHVLPDSGWISFRVRSEGDLERAVWLLRLSYLRYRLRRKGPSPSSSEPAWHSALEELRGMNLSPGLTAAWESLLSPAMGISSKQS